MATRWEYPDNPACNYTGYPDAVVEIRERVEIHPLLREVLITRYEAGERVRLPMRSGGGHCFVQEV